MRIDFLKVDVDWSGLWFPYNGDELVYIWPWLRKSNTGVLPKYRSLKLDGYYNSLNDYLISVGRYEASTTNKLNHIKSYDFDVEVLHTWIKNELRFGLYVVLYNINAEGKSSDFWDAIPDYRKYHFNKDVVVLQCKDTKQIKSICDSIRLTFADAFGIRNGDIIYWNED